MFEVLMPELGESISEGTITKWLKKVGERVEKDEPLFEVSTDKIDSEVPSPYSGYLAEILVEEGATVEVGQKLALISETNDQPATKEQPQVSPEQPARQDVSQVPKAEKTTVEPVGEVKTLPESQLETKETVSAVKEVDKESNIAISSTPVVASPMVRKMLRDSNLTLESALKASGTNKITREIAENLIQQSQQITQEPTTPKDTEIKIQKKESSSFKAPQVLIEQDDEIVPFDNIRKRTAEHMVLSKQVAPHAMMSKEVDFEVIHKVREKFKLDFEKTYGIPLSFLPFLARAAIESLRHFPRLNASVKDDTLVIHKRINLSVAVDLEGYGLIVPVIHDAHLLNLVGLALKIYDITYRARQKDLTAQDISKGTFTISNPGPFNTFMTYPIINQPQVAILSTDGISRKPVVVKSQDAEAIAIHSVGILTVSFDHRAVDGAYVARFLNHISEFVSHHSWEDEF
jgi:pyruvate dehydrogenase E2 component (dihydrolipoamide acetyltransferase)